MGVLWSQMRRIFNQTGNLFENARKDMPTLINHHQNQVQVKVYPIRCIYPFYFKTYIKHFYIDTESIENSSDNTYEEHEKGFRAAKRQENVQCKF